MMKPNDIIIRNAVSYKINDFNPFEAVDSLLEITDEVSDYLKKHIHKIIASDDRKYGMFRGESEIGRVLNPFNENNLISISKNIAKRLYLIINQNPTIPGCDLFIVTYQVYDQIYLGILKMNNQETYAVDNEYAKIVKQIFTLPMNMKLTEAAFIDLEDYEIELVEKKYEINGEKTNYFSNLFLECNSFLSNKKKVQVINKAIEKAIDKYVEEDPQDAPLVELDIRKKLFDIFNETDVIDVREFINGIGVNSVKAYISKYLKKYKISDDTIEIDHVLTTKYISYATLETDNDMKVLINLANYSRDVLKVRQDDGKVVLSLNEINALACKR